MTARWEDVLATQQALWAWWRTPDGHRYAKTFTADQLLKKGDDAIREVQEIQETTLFHADPIAIDPDMWTLIEYAQKEFKPEPLRETDIITEAGFIVLPAPLVTKDIWGKTVSYRAIGWMPAWVVPPPDPELLKKSPALALGTAMAGWNKTVAGVWVSLYSHLDDPDDYDSEAKDKMRQVTLAGGMPMLTLAHVEMFRFGQNYNGARVEDFESLAGDDYYTEHGVDWEKAIESYIHTRRSIQALFRLLSQHIAVHVKHRPSRPALRRAKRAAYPPKDVTVITLRRPRDDKAPAGGVGKHVEWTHRWLVRGFWRNQPYPSLGEYRQIWINPFIKGPADKELRIPEKRAFVLSR